MKDETIMAHKEIVKAGTALVKARRAAKKARQKMEEARRCIMDCASEQELRDAGIQYNKLGAMILALDEAMKCEGLVMQAHGHAADLVCACDMDVPTDDEIVGAIR